PGLAASTDDADCELATGQESFNQDRLAELGQQFAAARGQVAARVDFRSGVDPFACPFGNRLDEERKGELNPLDVRLMLDDCKLRSGDPQVAENALSVPLVQGECEDQWIGERVGNLIGVEERRYLGFATETVEAFCEVKHEVPAFAGCEARDQRVNR